MTDMIFSPLRMSTHSGSPPHGGRSSLLGLTLAAIGVVYGDIGTSPLYAIRECFFGSHSVALTHDNVLGVLSLILYSLLIVVSIKYIAIVMRADNQGEGGILALTALLPARNGTGGAAFGRPTLILLGIFGAALLYGDGMITPAITVLGAIEGLRSSRRSSTRRSCRSRWRSSSASSSSSSTARAASAGCSARS